MLNALISAQPINQIKPEDLSHYNRQLRNENNQIKWSHTDACGLCDIGLLISSSEYQNLTGISDDQVNELLQRGLSSQTG